MARPAARAAFENAGERQCLRSAPEFGADQFGEPVQQRHGQRAPLDDEQGIHRMRALGIGGVAQAQHLVIDEQPAIAIFGKPGQAVDVGDVESGAAAARSTNSSAIATACAGAQGPR